MATLRSLPFLISRKWSFFYSVLALREPTVAADVFSVAVILDEMLTGEHPFPGAGWPHLEAILGGERRAWTGPVSLGNIIGACMAPDVGARPTAVELASALQAFADSI